MNLKVLFGNRFLDENDLERVVKVESAVLKGFRHFFEENGFTEIVVPHITKATGACENIDTMFTLDYFGRQAYLSQTGQLYLEVMSPFFQKVWCCIHSCRAEPDVDNRHLTEFTLVEMEFIGNLSQLIKYTESAMDYALTEVLKLSDELELDKSWLKKFKPPYQVLTYTKAVDVLSSEFEIKWGDDLKSKHERWLAERFGPVFITHYPKAIKFFNMRENEENPEIVNSTDLILPLSGEAVGGAEREFKFDRLVSRLKESTMFKMLKARGGSIEDFSWYLNFWKENEGKLHSGCGIGVSRVVQAFLGLEDIRFATVWLMNRENLW